jgi:hypothetical protein
MLLRCAVGLSAVSSAERRPAHNSGGALALGLYGKQFCKSRFNSIGFASAATPTLPPADVNECLPFTGRFGLAADAKGGRRQWAAGGNSTQSVCVE